MKQRTLSFFGKAFFGKAFLAGLVAMLVSSQAQAAGPYTFRNGENGYTGQVDTQLRQAGVQAGGGATDDSGLNPINSDNQDGTVAGVPNPPVHAIIRFNDIIGTGPGQIPPGTAIANATLVLRSTAANANSPGPVRAHRLLQDWFPTDTWANSFGGDGVQADDTEANIGQDGADIIPNFTNPAGNPALTAERTVDVTTTVQAWINGAVPNYGWVLINAANDGYRIDSAETAIITNRPTLRVVETILAPNCIDQPDSTTVLQCRTATFSTAWEGVPPIQYSWLYEVTPGNYQPVDSVANPSAITPTLVISNVQPSHAGNYKLQASNQGGITDSDVATLTVTPDGDGPVAIKAVVSPDRTQITISYNEPVLAADPSGEPPNAQDPFDYSIREVGNPGNFLSVQQSPLPALVNETNIVLTIEPSGPQWVDTIRWEVDIVDDIPDACTGVRSAGQVIGVIQPLSIREGLNGYVGTMDTELREANPDTAQGTAVGISVDNDDGNIPPNTTGGGADAHGLLKFTDIFGAGANQIPVGATINNATLTIVQIDEGDLINVHRMLVDWDESATWNSMVTGVTNDNIEARQATSFTMPNVAGNPLPRTFNVTADMQVWADNPSLNFGWGMRPTGGGGWDFASKDNTTDTMRPMLTVEYTVVPTPVGIGQQPPPMITITEGQTLTISCTVTGFNPQIQWTRNGSPIPGATQQTYTKVNANPNDNGVYRLTAMNQFNSVTSDPCNVTVDPDNIRPTLVRNVAEADMTTIRLTYSEVMGASAGTAGNYTFTPPLTISSATLAADGSNVVLVTSARTFRQSYTLTINNVRDDAIAGGGNLLNPNPTQVTINSDAQRIVGFHDMWFWNTNCQDFTGWETIGFDPAANLWPEGPGSFGLETGGTLPLLAALGAQIQTPWVAPSANFLAAYLRKAVTIPAGLNLSGGAQVVIRYLRDDGMLLYVDGTETIRTSNMTNNPTYCTNLALNATAVNITEGAPETNVLAMTAGQTYQVAVQIQQNATGSSDVLFGAEILAIFPQPELTITHDSVANTVTVSWTPAGGQLEESTNLNAPNQGFANSLRQNGVAFVNPGTTTFYRVRR